MKRAAFPAFIIRFSRFVGGHFRLLLLPAALCALLFVFHLPILALNFHKALIYRRTFLTLSSAY